ncbi:Uma2 family endonuclease [soil metagenome]
MNDTGVAVAVHTEKRYFKVDEYHRMGEAGVFPEDDRVELVEGEIIEMTPIGRRHASCVGRLTEILGRLSQTVLWVQNPIQLDALTELQPDIALLKRREDFYSRSYPAPDDVLLVVEVSDTSAAYDREVKLPLYARSRIPEVWLVDLNESVVEIYVQPEGKEYREARRVGRNESLAAHEVPGFSPIAVSDILG